VSEQTAALLAGAFRLKSRVATAVKGKGLLHTFWLLQRTSGEVYRCPSPPRKRASSMFALGRSSRVSADDDVRWRAQQEGSPKERRDS
jgi:hypothetical protein